MKRLLAAISILVLAVAPASAMTRASAPAKFPIPFASSAATGTGPGNATYPIPTPSQIGITNCAASLTDGLPPKTMQPVSAGGCAPFGQDFNGILKQITQWNQQTQAGAVPAYDSSFSSSIGGYPEGSILSQASTPSCFWISQSDNNVTDPDTGGAGWDGTCPGGGYGTAPSTGAANAQLVATTPFALQNFARACFIAGYTNTGSLQINVNSAGLVNVYQRTQGGLVALVNGEVHVGMVTCVVWDGTQWELDTSAATASLVNPDQTVIGGANVTSLPLGTITNGTTTIDCGARPLQWLTNGGSFTLAAPANDGSCTLQIINNSNAGTITFSGFTVNSNYIGAPLTTVNGSKFVLSITRIFGSSIYIVIPQQQ